MASRQRLLCCDCICNIVPFLHYMQCVFIILDGRSMFSGNTLLYLIIGGCVLAVITIATVAGILCCRRREPSTQSPDRNKKGYQKSSMNVKPPDLWIHHDQMELKALEKSHSNNDAASSSGAMTLPRSTGGDFDSHDGHHHTNSLDKRTYAPSSYMCKYSLVVLRYIIK